MSAKRTRRGLKAADDGIWLPNFPEYRQKWLCLWEDPEGLYIVNHDGEYLCAESWKPGDDAIEAKIASAAKAYGIEGGRAVWIKARKVSDMEADDQMERLLEGKIPDEQEATLLGIEEEYRKTHGIS